MRTLMTVVLSLVASGCAWRGETKFVAKSTTLPPTGSHLGADAWTVDLDAKQLIFDGQPSITLSDAQVAGLKSSLGALAPASKESCVADGVERVLETTEGQVHYFEGIKSCSLDAPGTFFYVESLEKVFTELTAIAPPPT